MPPKVNSTEINLIAIVCQSSLGTGFESVGEDEIIDQDIWGGQL